MLRQKILFITILMLGLNPSGHFAQSLPSDLNQNKAKSGDLSVSSEDPHILLISLDGFRHDYLKTYKPPFLTSFVDQSCARLGSLTPVFPSKTFPNHWSLITGRYADEHGIVGNSFLNQKTKTKFTLSSPEAKKSHWYKGEPFWLTIKKHGLKSASYFWPGSDVDETQRRPDYYRTFDKSVDHQTRINQIVSWLSLPAKERPRFITLYFSDVDTAGHQSGPESDAVRKAIMSLDTSLKTLWTRLQSLPISVNVILVSDHGMQSLEGLRPVYLSDYLSKFKSGFSIVAHGPISRIYTDSEKLTQDLFNALNTETVKFKVYKRHQIPAHYHYSKDANIGDLLIVSDAPYFIFPHKGMTNTLKGEHGYDPYTHKDMGGIFYAKGPGIRGGYMESAQTTDVYGFLFKMMGFEGKSGPSKQTATLDKFLK